MVIYLVYFVFGYGICITCRKKHKENLETATWLQSFSEDEPPIGESCNRCYICTLKGWSYIRECDTPVSLLIKVEIFVSALSFVKKKLFTRNAK